MKASKGPKPTPKKAAKKPPKAVAKPAAKAKAPVTTAGASAKGRGSPSAGVDVGSRAPAFELKDEKGQTQSSKALAGSPYVLYFYPKDDTSGCTREACGFRDSMRHFGKQRVRILGVSPDSEESHARFAKKYGLPFTLLADPDKQLAKAYGVWVLKKNYGREYMGINRSTFVVDGKGVVRKVFRNVKVDGHVDNVLAAASAL